MNYGSVFAQIWPQLLVAAWETLRLALSALALGLVFGLVLALMRLARNRLLSQAAYTYIEVFRGSPALVQLFIIYFGLGAIGIKFGAFEAAVIGLGLNTAAYLAEVYRAGLEALPRGQWEAAHAIGMTKGKALAWIILPQAVPIVLPPIGNVAVSLLKDTSVASLISAPDLMMRAQDLSSEYFMPFEIYMTVGAMYFVLCFPLSSLVRHLEQRGHGRRSGVG